MRVPFRIRSRSRARWLTSFDNMRYASQQRGYTLLFAVLTASLVLGVAVFITNISRKQYILASTARDSTFAIYAADSGIECAALAVNDGNGIASTSYPNNATIHCSTDNSGSGFAPLASSYVTGLYYNRWSYPAIPLDNGGCAVIMLTFNLNSKGIPETIIDSSGYNVCKVDPGNGKLGPDTSANSQAVERALELIYGGVW